MPTPDMAALAPPVRLSNLNRPRARRLIEYLMSPLLRYRQESLREMKNAVGIHKYRRF
jgi:hypothetical protein